LGGRNAADQFGWLRLSLQHGLGDVVAVACAALVGVAGAHAVAGTIKQASRQERGRAPQPAAPCNRVGLKFALHLLKQTWLENGLMLSAVNLAPIDDLADIEAVLEEIGERAHAKAAASDTAAIRKPPPLAANALPIKLLRKGANGAKLQILRKDHPDHFGLGRDDHNLLIHCGIAERDRAADPNSLALGGSDLVAHPFPDQLAFELGKGQQHIERKPPHAGAGIE